MRKSEWLVCLVVLTLCLPGSSPAEELALVEVSAAAVQWVLQGGDFERVVLTVALPNGEVIRREMAGGQPVVFELDAAARDGVYAYELRGIPRLDASVRKELAAARAAGNETEVIQRLQDAGRLPRESAVQFGAFSVKDGALVDPGMEEGAPPAPAAPRQTTENAQVITAADVIPDDLVVQGSTCVGVDCVNNETFGFDTIRLKENNLNIHFDDTSSQAGFPANDWRLIANDSASGGQSKFSIEDITGAKVPFTITAGAANNSIFVDSTGRLGMRTSTPVLDVHLNTSNTPAIRLEQNNSGGFPAQTWDVAGNEANFFVRDVTSGSNIPFRIRPGAPTSSIDISASGNVGIGTALPASSLHVLRSDGTAKLFVQESSGTTAARELAELRNNGDVAMIFKNSASTDRWSIGSSGTDFIWNNQASAGVEMRLSNTGNLGLGTSPASSLHVLRSDGTTKLFVQESSATVTDREIAEFRNNGNPVLIFKNSASTDRWSIGTSGTDFFWNNQASANTEMQLNGSSGNLLIEGTLTQGSSRDIKTNFAALEPRDVLSRVTALPVSLWSYKTDDAVRHFGPVAEDFHQAFGLGANDKGIAPGDTAGIALAAIQGLNQVVLEKDAAIAQLEQTVELLQQQNSELASRLAAIEQLLKSEFE